MADVFVSYAPEDRETVRVLVEALQAQGRSVWWDTRAEMGDASDPVTEAELRAADCLIVVWSRQSIVSESVQQNARSRRAGLFSVVIDDVGLPEFLPSHPSVDLSRWEGDASDGTFFHLFAGVRSYLARRHDSRGYFRCNREEYDLAIAECSRAIELDPKLGTAYQTRALAHFKKKDYDRAIADCSKVIEIDPPVGMPLWYYYNLRGLAHLRKEDCERAIADSSKAIELNSEFDPAYYVRGLAYCGKGEYERAIGDYTQAIEQRQRAMKRLRLPEVPFRYHLGRARAYEGRGLSEDNERAKADYRQVLETAPSNADAKEGLARLGDSPGTRGSSC